jgi:hypothetical protein
VSKAQLQARCLAAAGVVVLAAGAQEAVAEGVVAVAARLARLAQTRIRDLLPYPRPQPGT